VGEDLLAQIRRELESDPRLRTLRYGEIVLQIQDGKLVFLEITEKRKPGKSA
jgi:Uncharacterized small protein (DUF2292).